MSKGRLYGNSASGALSGQMPLLPELEGRADQFYRTPYEPVRRMLHWVQRNRPSLLETDVYIEPCAGKGDIVCHVERHSREHKTPKPIEWRMHELRDEADYLSEIDVDSTIFSGARIENATKLLVSPPRYALGITNLPWPKVTQSVLEGFWRAYPTAWLIAFLSFPWPFDGNRPDWYDEHRPDHILLHGGRVAFGKGAYNHPVAWNIWRPRGEQGAGIFRVLSAKTCPQGPRGTI